MVSVVIVFLNAERFLHEAVESVLGQSYRDWELLLVDDGSGDASSQIASDYVRQYPVRIRYLSHEGGANRGISMSRNLGLARTQGEFVAFLDADDVWLPCKLERQVELLCRVPEAAMVYGSSRYWYSWTQDPADAELDFVPPLRLQTERLYTPPDLLLRSYPLGQAQSPPPSDILARRAAVATVGGFEDQFRGMYEDQAFFAKLYLDFPVYVSGEEWDLYRIHPESCGARAIRAGEYRVVRKAFLQWFAEYLQTQGVSDHRVWGALHAALAADSRPRLWRCLRSASALGSRLGNLARLIRQGGLRAHLRRRRWLKVKKS
jgi:glycosyltransferase involved in cell wall biosynthesis